MNASNVRNQQNQSFQHQCSSEGFTCDQDQAIPAAVRNLLSEDQDIPKACVVTQIFHVDMDFQAGTLPEHILAKVTPESWWQPF